MKRFRLLAVTLSLVFTMAIFAGCGGSSEPITLTTKLTPEQNMTAAIRDTLGTCNREGLEKVFDIDFVNAGYGYSIDIHFSIDDNLSEGWIVDGARMDIRDTMEALYTCGMDIQWVDMYGSFSMMDSYGNAKEMEVMHVRLGKDTASKINWGNMTSGGLFNILDFNDTHPAFVK